jgi:hypothetical protein
VSTWTALCIVGAAVLLPLVQFLRERRRDAAVRDMAIRRGFIYLGEGLPRSLTLNGTGLARVTSIRNVIVAERGATRIVAFDFCMGSGKSRWQRTGVAVQGADGIFRGPRFANHLRVERAGDWKILYEPQTPFLSPGLMPVPEIEAHLDSTGR